MRRYCARSPLCRPVRRPSSSMRHTHTRTLPPLASHFSTKRHYQVCRAGFCRPRHDPRRTTCRHTLASDPKRLGALNALALLREVIDEEVLAEPVGARVERAALVDARHSLDEGPQARAVVEHERVDDDAPPGDPLDLLQRLLCGAHADAAERQRPLAVEAPAEEVRRRLSVRDDDDVLVVARMPRQQLGRDAQSVLQVRERVAHVPAGLGEVPELQLDRACEEADDREEVPRVAGADQALHRHRDLLRCREASLPGHGPAHIEEEHRRRRRGVRRAVDLEVVGKDLERRPGPANERLLERPHEVQDEGIAVLVALRVLGAELDRAAVVGLVAAGSVAQQPLVDVAERELADLPDTLRRETRPALALGQVARVHEEQHDLLQELEVPRALGTEQRAEALQVDRFEVAGEELLLEPLQPLHLAHELDGLGVGERLRALEQVAEATLEVLQVAEVLELLEEVLERASRVVLEGELFQALERLGEARRQAVEEIALAGRRLGILRPGERVALDVEQLLEFLADLGERFAQVHLTIAVPHRLADLLEEVVEAHDADTRLPLEALVQEPVERLLHVVGEGQVLRQLLEDLIRLEADLLCPVPRGIADDEHLPTLPEGRREENAGADYGPTVPSKYCTALS